MAPSPGISMSATACGPLPPLGEGPRLRKRSQSPGWLEGSLVGPSSVQPA
eukprot:CAMPEP_0184391038 /NCGR_PEP_ID=MMETSP0007-20130409/13790_1 /TAXON_ID=97485 /ORGANISM="Prymnesium parvum, Strain Texoma1" /LENGTH=49 /DNA_ID=CAMNT_0026741013 /DNA_START=246 /DNA_END=395 /DNA_ORIENTATION=+